MGEGVIQERSKYKAEAAEKHLEPINRDASGERARTIGPHGG